MVPLHHITSFHHRPSSWVEFPIRKCSSGKWSRAQANVTFSNSNRLNSYNDQFQVKFALKLITIQSKQRSNSFHKYVLLSSKI